MADEEFYMTDAEIDAKHIKLRGSLKLKYPPREACCRVRCVQGDNQTRGHQCFLTSGHDGSHEFSSECGQIEPPTEYLGRVNLSA